MENGGAIKFAQGAILRFRYCVAEMREAVFGLAMRSPLSRFRDT
jgi:hypothetical protein